MEVIFSSQTFRDMILFSGRFANRSIPEENWKEVYGFLIGKVIQQNNVEKLFIQKLIPMVHGSRTEVYFSERDYSISETIIDQIHKAGLFICGWYHTHPGLNLFLSDTDIYNQLGFQSVFNGAIAAVFDFTKISDKNNGLKVYHLDDVNQGVASNYSELPYEIEQTMHNQPTMLARSLIDIAGVYDAFQPLIKEAGEILKDSGNLDNLLGDLNSNGGNKFVAEEREKDAIDLANIGEFKDQINSMETELQTQMEQQYDSDSPPILEQDFFDEYHDNDDSGFLEVMESYSENDFQIRAIQEQIERAKEIGQSTAQLMIKLADRYSEISKFYEALQYLESAEAEYIANNDVLGNAIAKNELGLYYEDRGDFSNALNYFESSLELLKQVDEMPKQIQVLNNIGNVYLKMNEHPTAFSYYKQAYIMSHELGYILGMVAALNNAVDVLIFLKNYGLAYNALMQNYHYFKRTQNYYGLSITFTKLGHLYFTQGVQYYPLSEKYFRLALDSKVEHQLFKETLDDWMFLYKIYDGLYDKNLAEISLIQGLNIIRTYELDKEEGKFYSALADLYLSIDKIDEAVEYFNIALESYEAFGDDINSAQNHEKIADIQRNIYRNNEEAINEYHKALESYRSERYFKKIGDILMILADLHIDTENFIDAKACLTEARSVYASLYDQASIDLIDSKLSSLS